MNFGHSHVVHLGTMSSAVWRVWCLILEGYAIQDNSSQVGGGLGLGGREERPGMWEEPEMDGAEMWEGPGMEEEPGMEEGPGIEEGQG